MANRIKGITIELGGDATQLQDALSDVNKSISSTQAQLKDVNKLLKLDPNNTELLAQKQRLLGEQISSTKDKLAQLQKAAAAANDALAKGEISKSQYDAIQREIAETEQSLKSLEDELKETNKSWKNWSEVAEKAGKVAKVAAEACAAAMAAAGAAVVKIVKDSVEAYADFEQLVGGVETLFKESADQVEQYASIAYKTAGLSANEYMETVTSFSASLLQSLGGDTSQAAKIADMAIIDMADNANKMGTDMASIQSAYQGFAKQNYTMLDNLKLGYGGTKTEMERLLADAEELTGIHYDISNLSDVYSAIHAIQGELDITGTTAKEASTTIQGSVSSMKSAWENTLVAFSDGNADVAESVNQLVDSVGTVLENIIPVVEQALGGVVTAIKELAPKIIEILPQLVEEILPNLLDAVMEMVQALVEVAPDIIETLITTILDYLPDLINCAVKMMIALIDGLSKMIPDLIPVALKAVTTLMQAILNNLPLLVSAAGKMIGSLTGGIISNLPQILSAGGQVIKQLLSALNPGQAVSWGIDMIQGFVSGILNMLPSVSSAAKSVASKVSSFLHFSRPDEGPLRNYEQWMPDFVSGLAESLKKSEYKLTDAVQGMANNMVIAPDNKVNGSLNSIQSLLAQGCVMVLDTGELVGATAKAYNVELGRIAVKEGAR